MDQPLFSCIKCMKNFPASEMSKLKQLCKVCNPHHSTFKQCEYCKSDFSHKNSDILCTRCRSYKQRYGSPSSCSICHLMTAFGSALVCQRCLHYRNRFGEPKTCQSCGQLSAFVKDEISRGKVDGQILCWVCTYNFKLARSRERVSNNVLNDSRKRRLANQLGSTNDSLTHQFDSGKRSRSTKTFNDNNDLLANVNRDSTDTNSASSLLPSNLGRSTHQTALESMCNENLLTIGNLNEEVSKLKVELKRNQSTMLGKDREIGELKAELAAIDSSFRSRLEQSKVDFETDQANQKDVINQLRRENASLRQRLASTTNSNRRRASNMQSSSNIATLFQPDPAIIVRRSTSSSTRVGKSSPANVQSSTSQLVDSSRPEATAPPRLLLKDDQSVSSSSPSPQESNLPVVAAVTSPSLATTTTPSADGSNSNLTPPPCDNTSQHPTPKLYSEEAPAVAPSPSSSLSSLDED